ncbi:MAG TPA: hypothetical protein VJN18_35565 [Polyangiaceae bacterium]|nr:hypothetical protein [Polyangiaceae bacterium]
MGKSSACSRRDSPPRLNLIGSRCPVKSGYQLSYDLCQLSETSAPSGQLGACSQLASSFSQSLEHEPPSLFRLTEHQLRGNRKTLKPTLTRPT